MTNKQYYEQIDNAIKELEDYKPYPRYTDEWICNRIDWCWKFRHITEEQLEELSGRICKILDRR